MSKLRKRAKSIIVNVRMPQGSYGSARAATAGFLFANPILGIIIIVVGLVLFMILGGLALPIVFGMFLNPFMWVLAIVISLVSKPSSNSVIVFAVLMGLLFWGYDVYMEYLAFQQICSIPIIGPIVCGGWNIITFIPKLFMLGLKIMVSFAMIWIGGFIRYQLEK